MPSCISRKSFIATTACFLGTALVSPISAHAKQELPASGTCGKDMVWELTQDGCLTISGKGKMDKDPAWLDYKREIVSVNIEEGVEILGDNAFSRCDSLESVSLPDSLKKIGDRAFYFCEELQEITLPASLEKMGDYVFYGSGLTKAAFADSTKFIPENALYSAEDLEEVVIPEGVTETLC